MRLIHVNEIKSGMILGKSIFTHNNKLLLGAGFRITSEFKVKLIERGYNHVYIMEKGTEDVIPEDIISDEIKIQAASKISDKAIEVQRIFQFKDLSRTKIYDMIESGHLKDFSITYDMKKVAGDILTDMVATGILKAFMFKSKNSYHIDHAINTTVLSVLLGKKYKLNKNDLLTLATGTFLHDFGKIVLEKLSETSKLDTVEELMNEHPTYGYLIVSKSKEASPMISQIIHQHHEQQDGKGYPIGFKGQNLPPVSHVNAKRDTKGTIYRLAEICSVANAYDNLVMNPMKEKKLTPAEAIKELLLKSETVYNKHIVGMLTKIVPAFPVGAMIKVITILDPTLRGFTGVVAKVNEGHRNKPVIILLYDRSMRQIKPRKIDTSKLTEIELELVI